MMIIIEHNLFIYEQQGTICCEHSCRPGLHTTYQRMSSDPTLPFIRVPPVVRMRENTGTRRCTLTIMLSHNKISKSRGSKRELAADGRRTQVCWGKISAIVNSRLLLLPLLSVACVYVGN